MKKRIKSLAKPIYHRVTSIKLMDKGFKLRNNRKSEIEKFRKWLITLFK